MVPEMFADPGGVGTALTFRWH
ncbi:hypothetical protein BRAS3809_6760008 [Bradyrhizobium sp. STM 3809]|nr:hypothetical protein BRAS3809_6760008 [Bradyrhizobium sp. STM 3809]